MPLPVNCCHQDSVWRSYITRSEKRSLPVVPKSSARSPTRRSNTIDALHSGQKVTATGTPSTLSFTISWYMRICSG